MRFVSKNEKSLEDAIKLAATRQENLSKEWEKEMVKKMAGFVSTSDMTVGFLEMHDIMKAAHCVISEGVAEQIMGVADRHADILLAQRDLDRRISSLETRISSSTASTVQTLVVDAPVAARRGSKGGKGKSKAKQQYMDTVNGLDEPWV